MNLIVSPLSIADESYGFESHEKMAVLYRWREPLWQLAQLRAGNPRTWWLHLMRPTFQWTFAVIAVLMLVSFVSRGGSLALPLWKAGVVAIGGAAAMGSQGLVVAFIRPWISLRSDGLQYQVPAGGGFLLRYEQIRNATLHAGPIDDLDVHMLELATDDGNFIYVALGPRDDLKRVRQVLEAQKVWVRDGAG